MVLTLQSRNKPCPHAPSSVHWSWGRPELLPGQGVLFGFDTSLELTGRIRHFLEHPGTHLALPDTNSALGNENEVDGNCYWLDHDCRKTPTKLEGLRTHSTDFSRVFVERRGCRCRGCGCRGCRRIKRE